jgi:hypothetical protein
MRKFRPISLCVVVLGPSITGPLHSRVGPRQYPGAHSTRPPPARVQHIPSPIKTAPSPPLRCPKSTTSPSCCQSREAAVLFLPLPRLRPPPASFSVSSNGRALPLPPSRPAPNPSPRAGPPHLAGLLRPAPRAAPPPPPPRLRARARRRRGAARPR